MKYTKRNCTNEPRYDPRRSFLPLVLYDPLLPCDGAQGHGLGSACLPAGHDASLYRRANYTAVLPYSGLKGRARRGPCCHSAPPCIMRVGVLQINENGVRNGDDGAALA